MTLTAIPMTTTDTISPQRARELSAAGQAQLLDVRTPAEFASAHASGARNLPLDRLTPELVRQQFDPARPLHILCKSGSRARQGQKKLLAAGIANTAVVEGGTDAWLAAGLPAERSVGRRTLPLDRQAFLVAGPLALGGTLLGAFVHPAWLLLPAVVGAGLTFAGATGFCLMAFVLGRMPWNQAGAACDSGTCNP